MLGAPSSFLSTWGMSTHQYLRSPSNMTSCPSKWPAHTCLWEGQLAPTSGYTQGHTHCTIISLPSDTLSPTHAWRVLCPRLGLSHLSSPVGNRGPSMDQQQHKFCFQVGRSCSQQPSAFKAHTSLRCLMSARVVKGPLRDALVLQHTWCGVLHPAE